MRHPPSRPSRRAIANHLEGLSALALGTTPNYTVAKPRKSKPRGERESGASDAIKEWRKVRPDIRIWRNNVGFYRDGSRAIRYGLCPGSSDFVGLVTTTVSQSMVGKRIAVFLAIEVKSPYKDAEDHQDAWLQEVKDAGAIAGVARNAQEAEDLLARWTQGMAKP